MENAISIGVGRWRSSPLEWKLQWLLRIGVALEFWGHGAFGILGKEAWLAYYHVLGIPDNIGWTLMPLTGAVDITLGTLVLLRPTRALIGWMAFWGLFTATLRPLAGQGIWELVERSYNYGGPLMLLLLFGVGHNVGEWVERVKSVPRLTAQRAKAFFQGFKWIIGLYLIGHGGLGLFTQKPLLIELYESIGLTSLVSDPSSLNTFIGTFEIGLGVVVLIVPTTTILLTVVGWKLGTEFLYVTSGAYGAPFEVFERGCSYIAPLAAITCRHIVRREEKGVDAQGPVPMAHGPAVP